VLPPPFTFTMRFEFVNYSMTAAHRQAAAQKAATAGDSAPL
jgi:hypothetical protein